MYYYSKQQQHQEEEEKLSNFQETERNFQLQNMSIGRQQKKNKTDIISIYKILFYIYNYKTCKTRCALGIKSGAGMKTSILLDNLIDNNIIKVNRSRKDKNRIVNYEITRYGEQVYEDLENLLTILNTDIISLEKKESLKLSNYC